MPLSTPPAQPNHLDILDISHRLQMYHRNCRYIIEIIVSVFKCQIHNTSLLLSDGDLL